MSAATPTGAELRARRERLGLSEMWIEDVLDITRVGHWRAGDGAKAAATGTLRRRVCEGLTEYYPYSVSEVAEYCAAYAAALDAEEARRASAEPVPPEGVTVGEGFVRFEEGPDSWYVFMKPNGAFPGRAMTAERLEFVAAMSRYRAAQHAAGDRQRKLDAVKAAEEVVDRAVAAHGPLLQQEAAAFLAIKRAREALNAARKEAGL